VTAERSCRARLERRGRRLAVERDIELFFLGNVEPHDRMERIERPPQIHEIFAIGPFGGNVGDEPLEDLREVKDLLVCPAHRSQWVVAAQGGRNGLVDLLLVGSLVRDDVGEGVPDVLEPGQTETMVSHMPALKWCDLGTPRRVFLMVRELDLRPPWLGAFGVRRERRIPA